MKRSVLLIRCPDRLGIVAKLSNFVFAMGGNIVKSHQHSTDSESPEFFMRIEFTYEGDDAALSDLERGMNDLAEELGAAWEIHDLNSRLRMAVAVSKYDHCLVDLLYQVRVGELFVDIPCVISNHDDLREIVERYASELGGWPHLVITGGGAPLIAGLADFIDDVVPDLCLMGVALAYRRAAQAS